jgi:hypothetical protein
MRVVSAALAARWVARVWSILSICTVLFFTVNALLPSHSPPPTLQEWLGLTLFPIGVIVGLVLAWYRETVGGIFALECLVAFYLWNLLRSGHLPRGPFFFLLAAPGLLFLIAASLSHRRGTPAT